MKLCDFTFAKTLTKSQMTSTVCGSPLYMAPEVLNALPYTEKADLWSVGVMMHQIFFASNPFKADNTPQLSALPFAFFLPFPASFLHSAPLSVSFLLSPSSSPS